jgi:hypothetical protein
MTVSTRDGNVLKGFRVALNGYNHVPFISKVYGSERGKIGTSLLNFKLNRGKTLDRF